MRNRLYSGAAIAVLAAFAVPAHAQQQTGGQAVELETINVEGQGRKAGAQHGDAQPTVATEAETVLTERATRQELESNLASDPSDINRLTSGASYSETTRSFNVRGLDRMRVSTTIDGIPLPYVDDGARGMGSPGATGGVSSIDFDTLSSIDIVKGSDFSVFGSGMLGGGVRLRTLQPEDLIEEGNTFGGLTKFAYDGRDDSWRGEQALAARFDNTFLLVQGGYRKGHETDNWGGLDVTGPTRTDTNPADYDQTNLLVKLRHHANGHVIGLTGEMYDRETDIDTLTINVAPSGSGARYSPGTPRTVETNKRQRVSLDYRYEGGGWLDGAEAVAFWQRQELGDDFTAYRTTIPIGDWQRNNTREQSIYGVNGSALKILDTDWAQHRVSFGGQIYGSESHQYSEGEDNCPTSGYPQPPGPFFGCNFLHTNQSDMPDTQGLTAAAFIQDEIALFDDTVRVTPGVRFDWYRQTPELTDEYARSQAFSNNGLPDESSDSDFSPKLRFEVDTAQSVTLFAQWAQAFRAPTVNELYLTYGAPGTYLRVGNDELDPETSNGFDVGVLVGDDRFGGSAKAFYNRYKNFIAVETLDLTDPAVQAELAALGYNYNDYNCMTCGGVTRYVNLNRVQIYGFELEAHYKDESGWHTWGRLGFYEGENMDTNVGLNSIPAAKGMLGVGYATDTWGADVIFTAAASRDYKGPNPLPAGSTADSGSEVENPWSATPSYQLIDLTAWWSPAAVKGLTLRAGIFNITDEKYFEDALDLTSANPPQDYFTEPGRNVRVSATYKF